MTLKQTLQEDIKAAMKARDKSLLDVLRLISAAVKQIEVDERIEVDDTKMLAILDKMAKQRNESIHHYQSAGRQDLIEQENYELSIIKKYLPEPFSEEAILKQIDTAFAEIKPTSIQDIAKLMAHLKPVLQGRADMGKVSVQVKAKLQQIIG